MEKELTGFPSIDQPWLKYYSQETIDTYPKEQTIYQNILENNKEYKENTAIRYYGNDITYGVMFEMIDKTAVALKAKGIGIGDIVNLCSSSCPEAIYIVLACSKIGAIANFINPLFTPEQIKKKLNETKSKLLFVMDEMIQFIEPMKESLDGIEVIVLPITNSMSFSYKTIVNIARVLKSKETHDIKSINWNAFIKSGDSFTGDIEAEYEKDRPVLMVYSSGTTGEPKGIMLTNDGINATCIFYHSPDFPYDRHSTFLQMIPVWFSTGMVFSIIMPLTLGITIIPELAFSKEKFVKDLLKYKPNMTLTATSLWLYAINSPKMIKADMSAMSYPITGGEALRPKDEEEVNNFLKSHGCSKTILKGYGMCELGSSALTTSLKYSKADAAGYPILHVSASAFNPVTNEKLRYGVRGEIRIDTPAKMKGYFNNEEATNKFFYTDEDGISWGCTGDIGYVDEEGYVYIQGRSTDSFIKEDGSVGYLFDSELVILEDKAVSQCKTIEYCFDNKKCLYTHIVLKDECNENVEDIIKRLDKVCREKTPMDEVPAGYKIRRSMPVHSNGKRNIDSLKKEKEGFIKI